MLTKPGARLLIQEIIEGPSTNQFSACFLFLNGRSYVHLIACRMRQHPIDFGNATTYAETVRIPELKGYAEKILQFADYNGLCEVEFKKDDRDGQYKFLEVNPRTWKWHSIANKTGTPFLNYYYRYLQGREIQPVEGYSDASFVHGLTDIPIRIRLLLRGENHWNRITDKVEYAVWAPDDMSPWLWEKIYLPYLISTR